MLKFPKLIAGTTLVFASMIMVLPSQAADVVQGKKVFNKCKACHAVGEDAQNRVGPHLNGLFGRTAGSLSDYKYSQAMKDAGSEGLVWDHETVAKFLDNPGKMIKGTKMAFAGLKKQDQIDDLMVWLEQETGDGEKAEINEEQPRETEIAASAPAAEVQPKADTGALRDEPPHGVFNLGRRTTDDEIAAWDIDVRPDGLGLPEGRGTVAEGETIFAEQCSVCHGVFGEGAGRWPVLAGGQGSLKDDRPVKTIGSYWPYLSTVYDYVRRTMPFGNARSLSDDDVYAITAYLLYLNDLVTDETFELSKDNFNDIKMPNEPNFKPDDRLSEPGYAEKGDPCMSNCVAEPAVVSMRAAVLDVTPDADNGDEVGAGSVD